MAVSVAAKRPAGVREFFARARSTRASVSGTAITGFMTNGAEGLQFVSSLCSDEVDVLNEAARAISVSFISFSTRHRARECWCRLTMPLAAVSRR